MGHYERLSALDATFVDLETRSSAMTVGAVMIFGPGPLVGPHGEIDLARLRPYAEAAVAATPRYRQRLVRVPLVGQPVWIDDEHFRLDFHLRHLRLPWPGAPRQLDELVGALFSQRLDRVHPLWRMWIVEGLASGGFAIVMQAHHAMTDGVGGVELIARLFAAPSPAAPAPPRPRPRAFELLRAEIRHHNRRAIAALRDAWRAPRALRGLADTMRTGIRPAPATPLNPRVISPHRRFETVRLSLADVRRAGRAHDATINDVALAAVAGALRRFLSRRGVPVDHLRDLRALVPVSRRKDGDGNGNRVAMMLADLPIAEPDPARRLALVHEQTTHLKRDSGQAEGTALATDVADAIATGLITSFVKLAVRLRAFNVTVTNIAGPPAPLSLCGSRLEAIYPKVPLYERQGVGFALVSYDGALHVGLSACWHTVPDLDDLAADLRAAFAELCALSAPSSTVAHARS